MDSTAGVIILHTWVVYFQSLLAPFFLYKQKNVWLYLTLGHIYKPKLVYIGVIVILYLIEKLSYTIYVINTLKFNLELATFEIYELDFLFVILSGKSVLGVKRHNIKGEECHTQFKCIKDHFFWILDLAGFGIKRLVCVLMLKRSLINIDYFAALCCELKFIM